MGKKATYCNPFGLDSKSSGGCVLGSQQPLPDMLPYLTESNNSIVYTHNNNSEESNSDYEIHITNPQSSQLYYTWIVTGNATIVAPYDIYSKKITVTTDSVNDEDFTVTCTVQSGIKFEDATGDYTHERAVGENFVEVTTISEEQAGSCTFETGETCVVTSVYKANHTYGTDFEWTVDIGEIIAGQGTDTITVMTNTNNDDDVHIECRVSNDVSFADLNADYVHDRTEHIILIASITDIIEDIIGSCDYVNTAICTTESQHTAIYENADYLVWEITGDGYIKSGQSTDTVIVESFGNKTANFTLRCSVVNDDNAASLSKDFSHARTEIPDPINISELNELVDGSCEYLVDETCVAQSTYQIVATDYDTLEWLVVGAIIISGQGTDSIVVETTGDTDSEFNVKCTATSIYNNIKSINYNYVHSRTEMQAEYSSSLLYNNTNIATEFIA